MTSYKCSVDACKRNSDVLCVHCEDHVCNKHYIQHVKLANNELFAFSDEINALVNKAQKYDLTNPVFEQLEQWREEKHRQIDEICDKKKRQLKIALDRTIDDYRKKLHELEHDVKKSIDEGDASFRQIEIIKNTIEQCRQLCKRFETLDYFQCNINENDMEIGLFNDDLFTGGGTLLSLEHHLKLNEFYEKKGQKWSLIYKASRDGFSASDFHHYCDDQGPTLTVIQSRDGGHLFGGYTSASWSPTGKYIHDSNNPFLFTLTNPHGIPPTKYSVRNPKYSIFPQMNCGPIFGAGNDLYCCDNSQIDRNSFFHFPYSYDDTTNRAQFCTKHYIVHVKLVNERLIILTDELNSLANQVQQHDRTQSAFTRLGKWREKAHKRIDEIYEEKKQQLQNEIDCSQQNCMEKLVALGREMRDLIDDSDASFKQIEDIKNNFEQCRQLCKRFETLDYFHCNINENDMENQGPTISVIQSKEDGKYIHDSNNPFLSTLTNPHGIPPTKYSVRFPAYAIFPQICCGPQFGGGCDLFVGSDSQTKRNSFFGFPHFCNDTSNQGSLTFTGHTKFQTNDIEVYRLIHK
ncbi:unnamed protein product [Rotaria socialis]|uniref:TLDc domain-containing protein n=1 Tax=Rotaria socialis TaxID=392032 RepID=A0A820VAB1_9BILA|nr:unnamed protein product [Rotaria socialis]